jgi:hypothetical protein
MRQVQDHIPLRALFAPAETSTAHRLIVEESATVVVVGPERRLRRIRRLWAGCSGSEHGGHTTYAVVPRS